jgi:hypothetical protein
MTKHEAQAIASAINGALGSVLGKLTQGEPAPERKAGMTPLQGRPIDDNGKIEFKRPPEAVTPAAMEFEALYQRIKRRLIDECRVDPILLQLLTKSAPEVEIQIEPRIVRLDGTSLRGRIAILAKDGFFKTPRSQADTNRELRRTGAEAHSGRLSEAFTSLVNDGFLSREDDGYQIAPGVKFTGAALEVA